MKNKFYGFCITCFWVFTTLFLLVSCQKDKTLKDNQLEEIYQLGVDAGIETDSYKKWFSSLNIKKVEDISFMIKNGYIISITPNNTEKQLYKLTDLVKPKAGSSDVIFKISENHLQWKKTEDEEWQNLVSLHTLAKKREDIFFPSRVLDGYLQLYKYGTWTDFIELSSLQHTKEDVIDDYKLVLYQVSDTHLQWKFAGDSSWNDLVLTSQISYYESVNCILRINGNQIQYLRGVDDEWLPLASLVRLIHTNKNDKTMIKDVKVQHNGDIFITFNNDEVKQYENPFYTHQVRYLDDLDNVIEVRNIIHGHEVTFPNDPVKEGYYFTSWVINEEKVDYDFDVKAIFWANENTPYTLNHYLENLDGTYTMIETEALIGYTDQSISAYSKHYQGFHLNRDHPLTKSTGVILSDGSLVLALYYDRNILNVEFVDYLSDFSVQKTIKFEGTVEAPDAPGREGYTFSGWDKPLTNITSHMQTKALYTPNQYTITLDVNGGDPLENDTLLVTFDDYPYQLPIPSKLGYRFVHWIDENNKTYTKATQYKNARDTTLKAIWEALNVRYTVKHYLEDLEGNYNLFESILHEGLSDTQVTASSNLYQGYNFDQSHPDNMTQGMVLADGSLILHLYYTKGINQVYFLGEDGSLLKQEQVKFGGSATPPTPPEKPGYTFSGWDKPFDNITTNTFIKATYTINRYTLHFDTDGGDLIADIIEDYNTLITLPTPEKAHHDFLGWTLDGSMVENVQLKEDMTVKATWKLTDYKISFSLESDVLDDLIVQQGKLISTLPVPTKENLTFYKWKYDNQYIDTPFHFTYGKDVTFIATWHGEEANILYEVESVEAHVIGYSGINTSLTIPDLFLGYRVTSLYRDALKNQSTIERIYFGENISVLEQGALSDMPNLNYVNIHQNTVLFGVGILRGSHQLEHFVLSGNANYPLSYYFGRDNVIIPSSLKTLEIQSGTLTMLKTLTQNPLGNVKHLIIPSTIESIDEDTFSGITSIEKITLPFIGKSKDSIGTEAMFGYVFGSQPYVNSYKAGTFYLPNTLKEICITDALKISENAFLDAKNIESIVLSNTVTFIEPNVFNGLSNLNTLQIPFIGERRTFSEYHSLGYLFGSNSYEESYLVGSYYLPKSLKNIFITDLEVIREDAFLDAKFIEHIVIHPRTKTIHQNSFKGLSSLQSVSLPFVGKSRDAVGTDGLFGYIFGTEQYLDSYLAVSHYIPNTLKTVKITDATNLVSYSFKNLKTIEELTLPNALQTINEKSFNGMSNLISLTIPFIGSSRSSMYNTISAMFGSDTYDNSYEANGAQLPLSLKTVIVTDATVIGDNAFNGAKEITSITLNEGLTTIGFSAFQGTTALQSINIPSTVTTIQAQAFMNTGLPMIIIPHSVVTMGSNVFNNANNINIYAYANGRPAGWDLNWNSSNRPVVWGYNE